MNAGIFGPVLGLGLLLAATAAYAEPLVDHPTIFVTVVQGQLHVSEDPVDSQPTEGAFVWRLPAGGGYEFPATGIVVASHDQHKCSVDDDKRQVFRCKKLKHVSGTKYKYTVNVIVSGSGQALPPLDPIIFDH